MVSACNHCLYRFFNCLYFSSSAFARFAKIYYTNIFVYNFFPTEASKKHLKDILEQGDIELVSHDKGKFGRILGEFFIGNSEVSVNQQMIIDHHAVAYTGGNKEEIEKGHLANREILLEQGVVEL